MSDISEKQVVEPLRRSYSEDEIESIYELARFTAENGDLLRAEVILTGLVEVAPDYAPAWLGMSFIHAQKKAFDAAIKAAQNALRANPEMVEAELFLISCYLTNGDLNAAGTILGEVGEKIEGGLVDNPEAVRFYRMQLARFENR